MFFHHTNSPNTEKHNVYWWFLTPWNAKIKKITRFSYVFSSYELSKYWKTWCVLMNFDSMTCKNKGNHKVFLCFFIIPTLQILKNAMCTDDFWPPWNAKIKKITRFSYVFSSYQLPKYWKNIMCTDDFWTPWNAKIKKITRFSYVFSSYELSKYWKT